MSRRCLAKNRKGKQCGAWALKGEKQCALHSDPERAAKMGSRHGRQVGYSPPLDRLDLPHRSLKNPAEVIELLEETINRVLQGAFDARAANAIGVLTRDVLKAQEAGASSVKTGKGLGPQLYAKRLYLPTWRKEVIERLEREGKEPMAE